MNPGVYGMSSGNSGQGKKIAGYVGKTTTTTAIAGLGLAIPGSGVVAVNNATVVAGVRTRLASVNARGAVLLAGVMHGSGVNSQPVIELVVDGEVLIRRTYTASANNDGMLVAGYASHNSTDVAPVPVMVGFDYIPFDGSAELWVTTNATLTSVKFSFLAELYK